MPKLNRDFIIQNLKEAREQIEEIIQKAETGDIDTNNFQIKMEHAYHHMNFAWNIRFVGSKRTAKCVRKDFNEWSKFPRDLDEHKI